MCVNTLIIISVIFVNFHQIYFSFRKFLLWCMGWFSLKLWEVLTQNKNFVIFIIYIIICNSLFVCLWVCLSRLLWNGSSHSPQTWWVGGAWPNLDFLSNFLASCYDWSSLHESFIFLDGLLLANGSSREAQTWWVGGAWANLYFVSNLFVCLFVFFW